MSETAGAKATARVVTVNLELRRFTPADAAAYAAIRYHPEVDTWLMPAPTDDPVTEQGVRIAEHEAGWQALGYGVFAVIERVSGALVGHCGLRWLADLQAFDTIWTIAPAAQGHGYAREAARAALVFGFGRGLDRIGALIRPDNMRSQAVARGLGMELREILERRPGQMRGRWDVDRAAFARRFPDALPSA